MVTGTVWRKAGRPDGHLCIGCLEARIGRQLCSRDFIEAPCNDHREPWYTERLRSRLRGPKAKLNVPDVSADELLSAWMTRFLKQELLTAEKRAAK